MEEEKDKYEDRNVKPGYEKRSYDQMVQWSQGNSIHNDIDNECCPDFSCCNKNVDTPVEKRKEYRELYDKEGQEAVVPMLMEFLGSALESVGHKVEKSPLTNSIYVK